MSEQQVRWTPSAFADLKAIHDRIKEDNPSAARAFARDIKEAVARLALLPEMGRVHESLPPLGRYRYVVVRRHQMIYRMVDSRVLLLVRLWDARRDPESLSPE